MRNFFINISVGLWLLTIIGSNLLLIRSIFVYSNEDFKIELAKKIAKQKLSDNQEDNSDKKEEKKEGKEEVSEKDIFFERDSHNHPILAVNSFYYSNAILSADEKCISITATRLESPPPESQAVV